MHEQFDENIWSRLTENQKKIITDFIYAKSDIEICRDYCAGKGVTIGVAHTKLEPKDLRALFQAGLIKIAPGTCSVDGFGPNTPCLLLVFAIEG